MTPRRGRRIEIAGGLVGEHDRRTMHERARDRHALQLAARELARHAVAAVGEPDRSQHLRRRVRRSCACACPRSASGSATFCATVR